jgi:hypothetical protein
MTIVEYFLMIGAIGLFFAVDWWIERPRGDGPVEPSSPETALGEGDAASGTTQGRGPA